MQPSKTEIKERIKELEEQAWEAHLDYIIDHSEFNEDSYLTNEEVAELEQLRKELNK